MSRRLKRQVAQDLPDRIEERRDCELGEAQRKLYLAELRRSREKVMQTHAGPVLAPKARLGGTGLEHFAGQCEANRG